MNKKIIVSIIIVFILLLIFGGVFWWWRKNRADLNVFTAQMTKIFSLPSEEKEKSSEREEIIQLQEKIKELEQETESLKSKSIEERPEELRVSEEQLREFIENLDRISEEMDKFSREMTELSKKQDRVKEEEEEKIEEEQPEEELSQTLPKILISEVCVGLDKSQNEFIELFNPNDSDIDLGDENFKLKLVNSSNNVTEKQISWTKDIIPAKGYFLLVGGKLMINGRELEQDANFNSQLTGTSGVIITDNQDNILDKVSWGKEGKLPPSDAVESRGIILENGLKTGQSLERKSRASTLIDTDNNFNDFVLSNAPAPTNSSGEKKVYSLPSPSGGGGSSGSGTGTGGDSGGTTPQFFPVIINEIIYDLEGSDEGKEFKC